RAAASLVSAGLPSQLAAPEPAAASHSPAALAGAAGARLRRTGLRARRRADGRCELLGRLDAPAPGDTLAAAPAPPAAGADPAAAAGPRTRLAEVVAQIFADLLGRERVGDHDSFFDLGGHSLLATQAVSRLRELAGVEVPLRAFFARPTVAGVAAAAAAARGGE